MKRITSIIFFWIILVVGMGTAVGSYYVTEIKCGNIFLFALCFGSGMLSYIAGRNLWEILKEKP